MNRKIYKELFWSFFKIGATTFGGGYAMIPLIKKEIVEDKQWLTNKDIFNIIAIAESTPGPLAITLATFIGSRISGMKGALIATLGVVLPSFITIAIVSKVLLQIESIEIVKNAFTGIRAGVLVLIGSAFISLFRQLNREKFTYIIMLFVFILAWFLKINTILLLFICGFLGVMWSLYLGKKAEQ